MKDVKRIAIGSILVALVAGFTAGCIVGPQEGYYDRDHHRYYYQHVRVACGDHDDNCR